MRLEDMLGSVKEKWLDATAKFSENPVYKYAVDVLSGWGYYTPTYAAQELAVGKDIETVFRTRLLGMAVHMVVMRPSGLLRNYVAKKWNVTQDSSLVDKIKVNLVAITPLQAVTYAGMLAGGMAWSGHYDINEIKSSAYAWIIGVGLGVLHAIPYGFIQDKVRTFFGVKPAFAARETMETM